jgi:hypothetical protein
MQEQFNNVIEGAKSRLGNPIISSFIISFIGFNWESFFLLLWDTTKNAQGRILHFNSSSFDLYFPLLFAILIPLISPLLKASIEVYEEAIFWLKTNLQQFFNKGGYVKREIYNKQSSDLRDTEVKAEAREQRISELRNTINKLTDEANAQSSEPSEAEDLTSQEPEPTSIKESTEAQGALTEANDIESLATHKSKDNLELHSDVDLIQESDLFNKLKPSEVYSIPQLYDFFSNASLTSVQRKVRQQQNNNVVIQVRGEIYVITQINNPSADWTINIIEDNNTKIPFVCYFTNKFDRHLAALHKGESVIIEGKLSSSNVKSLKVMECVKIKKLSHKTK